MTETSETAKAGPRDAGNWAERVEGLKVGKAPSQARNINVEGRRVASPIQGFGQMWQKTYRIQLADIDHHLAEILKDWQKHFAAVPTTGKSFPPARVGDQPGWSRTDRLAGSEGPDGVDWCDGALSR